MGLKRIRFYVQYNRKRKEWEIKGPEESMYRRTKGEAVTLASYFARVEFWKGGLSQLIIKGKNGRIQKEHTYGRDPRRYKS